MIKKTFYACGSRVQETAAKLNQQIKDYLLETGLFRLRSTGEKGGYPQYTLEYKDSGYLLELGCLDSDHQGHRYIVMGMIRGSLDEAALSKSVWYGAVTNARLTIHLLVHGDSMAFKVIDADNQVCFGGSCIRYTDYSGRKGYLYNANEVTSLLGYMGRYEIEPGQIAGISYFDYSSAKQALAKDYPIICCNGAAIGYANDLVIINGNRMPAHHSFACLILDGDEYHGGRIPFDWHQSHLSQYAATAMKCK